MNNVFFLLSFVAEFAVAFLFVSSLFASKKPSDWKTTKKALLGIIMFTVLSVGITIESHFYLYLLLSCAFLLYGINLFIQSIKYRAKQEAIKQYNKKAIELKYDFNSTIERINLFITFIITLIIIFLGIFLGSKDSSFFVGLIFLFLVVIIMLNYFVKAHIKDTLKFDANSIKANLSTLIFLTLILSVMIFYAILSIPFNNDLQNQLKLYPIFTFIMVLPLILVSDYFLQHLRMTFFENKKISEYFISNLLAYTIVSLIIIIFLSDVTVAYSVLKSENYENMIMWVNGFVIFIGTSFLHIIKKSYLYKLESHLIDLKEII